MEFSIAGLLRQLGPWVGADHAGARRFGRLFALIFVVTFATVLAKSAQRGLFLVGSERGAIPNAFFWSALALAAASLVTAVLASRVRLGRLTTAVFAFGGAGFLALWGAWRSGMPGAPLLMYAGVEALTGMLLTQAWILCATALDVREAKRLMPVLGGASALAWILGGLGAGYLGQRLAADALLPLAAALVLGVIEVARRIGKQDLPREFRASDEASPLRAALRSFSAIASPGLLRWVTVLAVLEQVVDLVIEFQLLAEAQARFRTSAAISGFIGELYAVSGIATVLAPFLLARPVLTRFGSARALTVGPIFLIAASFAFLGSGALLAVAVLSVGERVFKVALTSPARAQIQGALGTAIRAQAGLLARGVIAPLFHAACSLALELFPPDADPRLLAWATVAISAVVIAIAAGRLQEVYVSSLRDVVVRGRLDLDRSQVRVPDAQLRTELERELAADTERALLAISVVETLAPVFARPLLASAVHHSSLEVRVRALEGLAEIGAPAEAALLRTLLPKQAEPAARAALLRALHQLRYPLSPAELAPLRQDPEPWVAAHALALSALSDPDPDRTLLGLLRAPAPEVRTAALQALAVRPRQGSAGPLVDALRLSLGDPAALVRHQALRTAMATHPRRFLPDALQALSSRADRAVVVEILQGVSPARAAQALSLLATAPGAIAGWGATAVADIPGPEVHRALLELLASESPWVRYRSAWALARRRTLPGEPAASPELARAAVGRELELAERYRRLLALNREPFFEREVEIRLLQAEVRLLALLEAFGAPRALTFVRQLRDASPHVRGRVLELLENMVEPELARAALPFFERESPRDLDGVGPEQIVTATKQLGDIHLVRCAALAFGDWMAENDPDLFKELQPLLPQLERLRLLRGVNLFRDLSPEDLMKIAAVCEVLERPAQTVLFRKGDVGDALYIVAEGEIAISDRGVVLNTLHRNEHFGEIATLDGEPRMADARCETDCRLVRLATADLEALMDRRPEVGRTIVRTLAKRLRAVTEAHVASDTSPGPARMAAATSDER